MRAATVLMANLQSRARNTGSGLGWKAGCRRRDFVGGAWPARDPPNDWMIVPLLPLP